MPGGCTIGSRPIDLHLKGLEAMGLRLVRQLVTSKPRQNACMVLISIWTFQVLVQRNLMMAATLADGVTVMRMLRVSLRLLT